MYMVSMYIHVCRAGKYVPDVVIYHRSHRPFRDVFFFRFFILYSKIEDGVPIFIENNGLLRSRKIAERTRVPLVHPLADFLELQSACILLENRAPSSVCKWMYEEVRGNRNS